MSAIRIISLTASGNKLVLPGFTQGETVEYHIVCLDPVSFAALDLTACTIAFSLCAKDVFGKPQQPPIISRPATVSGSPANGNIVVPIAVNDTAGTTPVSPGEYVVDLIVTDGSNNRLELLPNSVLTLAPAATLPTSPVTPLPSQLPLGGVRLVTAGASMTAGQLVKPNGSGKYIPLGAHDDGIYATGVALASVANNAPLLVLEGKGQLATCVADGTDIFEGSIVYASNLNAHGGHISAVSYGQKIGICTIGTVGTVVQILWS